MRTRYIIENYMDILSSINKSEKNVLKLCKGSLTYANLLTILKGWEARGIVTSVKHTRERIYSLTEKGQRVLKHWFALPKESLDLFN